MLRHAQRNDRGDTLIEVLFAITIFAMVMVGALSIMNQGVSAAQRSLEITQVRQHVDAQAEAIRFIHSSYVSAYAPGVTFAPTDTSAAAQWPKMIARSVSMATPFVGTAGTVCPTPSNGFVVNVQSLRYVPFGGSVYVPSPAVAAQVTFPADSTARSEGVAVQAVRSPATPTANGYVDFHITGCWSAPGMSRLMTIGSIVRLYEPR